MPQHRRRYDTDAETRIAELERQNALLREMIARRSIYEPYGCLTRAAIDDFIAETDFDGYGVAFFDLDEMKRHNTDRGKTAVNASIKYSIAVRGDDVATIGLWFSGDEFVIFAPAGDIAGLCQRIQQRFNDCGMSATMAYTQLTHGDRMYHVIDALDAITQQTKNNGARGTIRRV